MIGVSAEHGDGLERIRVEGSLTAGEVRSLIERFGGSVGRTRWYLVDLSRTTAGSMRFPEVSALAQLACLDELPRNGARVGILAPHPAVYGVCRMFQGLRHDLDDRLTVFASESECAAWMRGARSEAA